MQALFFWLREFHLIEGRKEKGRERMIVAALKFNRAKASSRLKRRACSWA